MSRERLTRRAALSGLAAIGAASLAASVRRAAAEETRPVFSASGPNADLYGAATEYPVPDAVRARWQGNPWHPADRVGAFTHIDEIYPTRQVNRAETPWTFKRATADLSDSFGLR